MILSDIDYLYYKFPNEEIQCFSGTWIKTDFTHIPEGVFFVSNFNGDNSYYFEINKNESLNIDLQLHLQNNNNFTTDKETYIKNCIDFIQKLKSEKMDKAILSRVKSIPKLKSQNVLAVYKKMSEIYHDKALVYLISSSLFGTWMGATPEILISGNADKLHTVSLAGTKLDKDTKWTSKELEEQQIVTDYILDNLKQNGAEDIHFSEVYTTYTGVVFHLKSDISFKLNRSKWRNLISDLHPTPAVCGQPKLLAKEIILDSEKHERRFYTGMIGFLGSDKLKTYVNLRCMEVNEKEYLLYLGGGITQLSNPEDEWQETENKAKTLIGCIDL